jgi:RNA polymerase sigma-70 factor (ECF subfamily)
VYKLDLLIERCKDNNRKAQSELYDMWFSTLMRIARKYKNNEEDAASIVNDAFFKIFTNIQNYKQELPFEAWIKRITINTVIDEFRKNKKHKNLLKLDDYSNTDFLDFNVRNDEVDEDLNVKDILNLIEKLDEEEKVVFNLFEIDGYSHNEIAKELEVSERTSKRYLASARVNLRKMITQIFETVKMILLC